MFTQIHEFLLRHKNFIKSNFSIIIIIILLIIIFLQRACTSPNENGKEIIRYKNKKYEVIKRETDTQIVTVPYSIYIPGESIYVQKPIYVPVPANVDTNNILKDYFAKYVYKDTLDLDSLGYVILTDTISKNKIDGRIWDSKINKYTVTNEIVLKELPRTQLYVGGSVGTELNNNLYAGADIALKTKKDQLYRINAGITSNLNPYVNVGMYWKISLKKNK
jgi:hypothetical protein